MTTGILKNGMWVQLTDGDKAQLVCRRSERTIESEEGRAYELWELDLPKDRTRSTIWIHLGQLCSAPKRTEENVCRTEQNAHTFGRTVNVEANENSKGDKMSEKAETADEGIALEEMSAKEVVAEAKKQGLKIRGGRWHKDGRPVTTQLPKPDAEILALMTGEKPKLPTTPSRVAAIVAAGKEKAGVKAKEVAKAKKLPEPKAKAAKAPKTKKSKDGAGRSRMSEDTKLTVIGKPENPAREGTKTHKLFQVLLDGRKMTFGEYVKGIGSKLAVYQSYAIRHGVEAGWLKVEEAK